VLSEDFTLNEPAGAVIVILGQFDTRDRLLIVVLAARQPGCPGKMSREEDRHMGAAGSATGWQGEIRHAGAGDIDGVAALAAELAMSFEFSPEQFRVSYPALLAAGGACLLLAADGSESAGYLLGFRHLTFYANGPVAWVEEVVVRDRDRGQGIGRALMDAFEEWAAAEGCALVALATRRAAPFYLTLGYEESATYFRKVLVNQERP
jgi:GNAT superfamily N-acetyltransferase